MAFIQVASRIVTLSDGALRREHGVTGRDYELLHHLSGAPSGLGMTELAGLIDDSSSCITHRINRLSAAGLVDKRIAPEDRRARTVSLTANGRLLLERVAPGHVRRVRGWVVDPLSAADLTRLGTISATLLAHLRTTEPLTD